MKIVVQLVPARNSDDLIPITYGCRSDEHIPRLLQLLNKHGTGHVPTYTSIGEYPDEPLGDKDISRIKKYSRKKEVLGARALAIDIDVRPGSDKNTVYQTPQEAIAAIKTAIDCGMPRPTRLVATGGGYHLWWDIDELVSTSSYVAMIRALKKQLPVWGLIADTAPGANPSGIMRTVGSVNAKRGGAIVKEKQYRAPYSVSEMSKLLDVANEEDSDSDAVGTGYTGMFEESHAPMDAGEVYKTCAQLQRFKTEPKAIGYPVYFDMLTVAARTTHPEGLAHKLTSFDKDWYNKDTVQSKLEEAINNTGGPASCSTFNSHAPGVCSGCPHFNEAVNMNPVVLTDMRLRSAEQLEQVKKIAETPTDELLDSLTALEQMSTNTNGYTDTVDGIKLPKGYVLHPKSAMLYYKKKSPSDDGEEEEKLIPVSHGVFVPHFWYTSMDNTKGRDVALMAGVVYTPNRKPLKRIVDIRNVMENAAKELITIQVDDCSPHKSGLANFYRSWRRSTPGIDLVGEFGYSDTNHTFAGYSRIIDSKGESQLQAFTTDMMNLAEKIGGEKGSFSKWRQGVQGFFDSHASMSQKMQFLHSAASPLIYLGGAPGALVLSVVGETGAGKTFGHKIAHSFWGKDIPTTVPSASTPKSLLKSLTELQHMPFMLDETTRMSAENKASFIFDLSGGAEGNRLGAGAGGAGMVEGGMWNNSLLLTSNDGWLRHQQGDADERRAKIARIAEIRCTPSTSPDIEVVAAGLEATIRGNHGVGWVPYMQHILKEHTPESISQELAKARRKWRERIGGGERRGITRFTLDLIAFSDIASKLLVDAGIFEEGTFDDVLDQAVRDIICFSDQHESELDVTDIVEAYRLEHIRDFVVLGDNGQPVDGAQPMALRGWHHEGSMFVSRKLFDDYVSKHLGVSISSVLALVRKSGLLCGVNPEDGARATRKNTLSYRSSPIHKSRTWCYVFPDKESEADQQ